MDVSAWITVEETAADRQRDAVERVLAGSGVTVRIAAAGAGGWLVQVPEDELDAALSALEAFDDADS